MNRSTLVWLGVLGIGGYLLYRWASGTIARVAPQIASPNLAFTDPATQRMIAMGYTLNLDGSLMNAQAQPVIAPGGFSGGR
jgi:hypothetical protein